MEENKIQSIINEITNDNINIDNVLCTIDEKNVGEYFREILLLNDNELDKLLTKESCKLLCEAISKNINQNNIKDFLEIISRFSIEKIIFILTNENLKEICDKITNNINENNTEYYLDIMLKISQNNRFDEIFSTSYKDLLDKIINNITKSNIDKILNILYKEAIKNDNDKQFKNITFDNIKNFLSTSTGIQIFNKLINFISSDNVDKFCYCVSRLEGKRLKAFLEKENNNKSTLLNTISKHINTNNSKKCFLMLLGFRTTAFGTFATNKNGEELLLAIFNNIARETVSDFTYIMLNTINIESFETFVNSNAGIEMFNNIAKNINNKNVIKCLDYITNHQGKTTLKEFINNKNTQIIFQKINKHLNSSNTEKFITKILNSTLLDIIVSSDAGREIFDNILKNITEENIINCFNKLIQIRYRNFNTESFNKVCNKIEEKINTNNACEILKEIITLNTKQLGYILNNKDIQQILQSVCNNITNENAVNYFNTLSLLDKDKLNILSSNKIIKQIIDKTIENTVKDNNNKYLIQLSFEKKEIFDTFFTKNGIKIVFNDDSLNKYINIAKLCELMSFSIDKYRNEISNELNINKNDLLDFVKFGLEKIERTISKDSSLRKIEIDALMEILQEYLFSKLEVIKSNDNLERVNKLMQQVHDLQIKLKTLCSNLPKLQSSKTLKELQKPIKTRTSNVKKENSINTNLKEDIAIKNNINIQKDLIQDNNVKKDYDNIVINDSCNLTNENNSDSTYLYTSQKKEKNKSNKDTIDNLPSKSISILSQNHNVLCYNTEFYIFLFFFFNYLQRIKERQMESCAQMQKIIFGLNGFIENTAIAREIL